MKKVFILGGTGFLGYYTTRELLKRGYEVSTVALPPLPTKDLLPEEVTCVLGNINEMSDEQVLEILKDTYAFVYAAGADERMVPAIPAKKFFYEANVLPTQRLAHLAREAGVKKFVVFGSYFAEFAERLPETDLKNQAYPNMRLLQEDIAFAEGEGSMDVMSLRLPYIFGTMPGRKPLWTMMTDPVKGADMLPVSSGGTAMVSVQQVAEAAVGAIENGKHRGTYAICGENMSFFDFYSIIVEVMNQKDKTQLMVLPFEQVKPIYEEMDQKAKEEGLEHGIHAELSAELREMNLYLDPKDTKDILKYGSADIHASIVETIQACIEE